MCFYQIVDRFLSGVPGTGRGSVSAQHDENRFLGSFWQYWLGCVVVGRVSGQLLALEACFWG